MSNPSVSSVVSSVRYRDMVWTFGALALVAVAIMCIRIFCAFTFPIPWNDESDFIAPAFEMSRSGSFFVYGMNPDRVVMWMPPGFMLLLAAVFKVFGYSFDVARWTSAVLFIAAYAVSAIIVFRSLRSATLVVALLASLIAFLSPYSLAIANIARMEAFYTLTLLLALSLTLSGKPWVGLSIVLVTALIHFNAVYFLIPFAAYFGERLLRYRRLDIVWTDIAALSAAFLAILAYVVYAVINWQGFVEDMRFQFAFKSVGPAFFGLGGKFLIASIFSVVGLQWFFLRRFGNAIFISGFGASFVLLYFYGKSMWYVYSGCIGFYLLVVGALVGIAGMSGKNWGRYFQSLFCIFSCLFLIYFSIFRVTPEFRPLWLRAELFKREYIDANELAKVSEFIRSTKPGAIFNFGHSGIEPFFFRDVAESGNHWTYAVYSVTQPLPFRITDYYVVCDSELWPKYLQMFELGPVKRKSSDSGCNILDVHPPF